MTTPSGKKPNRGTRARSIARKLAMQALYQWQLTGQSAADINLQFLADEESAGADLEYFTGLLKGSVAGHEKINAAIARAQRDNKFGQGRLIQSHRCVLLGSFFQELTKNHADGSPARGPTKAHHSAGLYRHGANRDRPVPPAIGVVLPRAPPSSSRRTVTESATTSRD